ncbi:MAG: hypothetical protein U5L11_02580 [Arhodomonas sp.]|nr:hypothetical protein [Arhodomonas sp.]
MGSSIQRLQAYQSTGNAEHLVDVANLCLSEFHHRHHPLFHFQSTDDGQHCEEYDERE